MRCEWCGSRAHTSKGQCPNTIRKTDDPQSREFWRFVRRTVREWRKQKPSWAKG